ncbi:hypothetical protein C0993_002444 [Termitomyces sp. T159_Od127]|nr:hypothetical protein C0993_002444 [Termitomyces sp. T159_Od127]
MSAKDSAYSGSRSYKSSKARPTRVDHTKQHTEHSRRDSKPPESSKRDTDHYLKYYQSSLADGRVSESDQESSSTRLVTRQDSGTSSSSSDYSDDHTEFSTTAPLSISKVTRRSKIPSDGGSDRRRLAIVQMDPLEDSPPKKYRKDDKYQSPSIRTRRGVTSDLTGIALVAPPDAAPSTYTHLTPPTTAPTTADVTAQNNSAKKYHKDAPDVTNSTGYSSRESVAAGQRGPLTSKGTLEPQNIVDNKSLTLPGNQQSKPPQLSVSGEAVDSSNHTHELLSPGQAGPSITRGNTPNSVVTTPEIGERKDVGVRVAAPVIINLDSAGAIKRKETTSQLDTTVHSVSAVPLTSQDKSVYLHYEPGKPICIHDINRCFDITCHKPGSKGVHSTAGPLPPLPPRAMFNIDVNSPVPPRPPRLNSPVSSSRIGDIDAVKKAPHLPPSVMIALSSRTPKPKLQEVVESAEGKSAPLEGLQPDVEIASTSTSELHQIESVHRREGAFSTSPLSLTATTPVPDTRASQMSMTSEDGFPHGDANALVDSKPSADHASAIVPPITVISPIQHIEEQVTHEEKDVSTDMISSSTPRRHATDDLSTHRSQSPLYQGRTTSTPSPPPKSFRNSLTTNLKRLSSSLPRTSSLSSKSRRSSDTFYSSRTPSPPMQSIPLPPPRPKIISSSPPAMFCTEISTKRTSIERCTLYAQKINELYMYDSGLSDWTIEAKQRANNNRPTVAFSSQTFTPQPRHTSRSSIISEFPRRPDASVATDLTIKSTDLAPAAPPVLPYPSLVNNMYQVRSSSLANNTPPGSIRSLASSSSGTKSSGGFFASLGRKNSVSSSKKPGLAQIATNQQARVLTKPPPTGTPRLINIPTSPVVPGGPRAIPNRRAARSQTLMTTNSFASNASTTERNEVLGRHPSLLETTSSVEPAVIDIAPDPEFVRQVDKLAHLLPEADRGVLEGYLRRAGQDILAIGQYLEDEKNGTVKPPW